MFKSQKSNKAKKVFIVLLAILFCSSLAPQAMAQDRSFDRYKHYESQINHGRGASESDDASYLSWGEAYILDSYIDIYNDYRDTYWLDKFVDHFDRVKANAKDPESDGSFGWYTPSYSYQHMENHDFETDSQDASATELISNGGFESSGADGVPSGWTRVNGTNTTAYRTATSGEYYSGTAGVAIKYNSGSDTTLKQAFSYYPGRKYTLKFAAKTANRKMVGQVQIYNETTSTVLAETAALDLDSMILVDEWVERNLSFRAPSAAGQTVVVKLKLAQINQPGWAVYYDDISIMPVETIVNTAKNADFEIAAAGDATLPDKWTRFGANSNVYRSSAAGEYYSGSHGLVVKSNGTTWQELYQSIPYKPGAAHSVTFWGKTNSASAYGRILVYDATTSAYILDESFNNTAWEKKSYTFTAPGASGNNLIVYLRQYEHSHPAWIAYFDDLEIEPIVENVNDNSSFSIGTVGDATLPDGWERYQSTSSNAYLSSTLNEYFSYDQKGVVIKSNNTQVPMLMKRIHVIPGMQYTVKYWGRNNSPAAQGVVNIYNSTAAASITSKTFSNTEWEAQSFTFTAPAAVGDAVYVLLGQAATAADNSLITYIDDLEVIPAVQKSFASWTRVNKNATTAYTSNVTGNSRSGYGLVVGNDGSTDGYVKQKLLAYTPNKLYGVSFYGKTNTASNDGKIVVYDVTASTELASMTFENTEWAYMKLDFTTPAANHDIEIRLTQQFYNNSAQYAYFDDVIVGQQVANLVADTMISKPALKFIKAVYEDSNLTAGYKTKADEYLEFIEDHVLPKHDTEYEDLGSGRGVYLTHDGNAGAYFPNRTLPHNQYLVAAECYLFLWDITANAGYKTRADSLLNFFKDNLRINDTAYTWNYWDSSGSWDNGLSYNQLEDTSHANLDISAAVTAYHYGTVFNHTDMERFASTFVDKMWNGSTSNPVIGINTETKTSTTEHLYGWTPYIWEFVHLAEFDPQIWSIIQTSVINRGGSGLSPLLAGLAVYNPETTVNGNFELKDRNDNTLPEFWNRYLIYTTSDTAYRDTANKYTGDAGLALKTNGTAWNILQQPITNYLPNSLYEVKYRAKAGSGSVQARADIYDYTALSLMSTSNVSNTTWTSGTMSYTTPATTINDIRLDLYHDIYTPANQFVYFDDVNIYASLWNSFAPNSGFEEADLFDSTLPKYWKRSATAVSGKVVLDTTEKYRGTNSIKLTTETAGGNPAQQIFYTLKGLKPSASYTVTFYSKTNGSAAKAKARVRNETASMNLATSSLVNSTSWANYTVSFTAPATYTDEVRIYLEHDDPSIASGIAYFDEVGVLLN